VIAIVTLLLVPLLAFGGRNPTVAVSLAAVCMFYAALTFPQLGGPLDRSLLVLTVCALLQLLPLPSLLEHLLSPHADDVRAVLRLGPPASSWEPLSIDPRASGLAAFELLGTLALFVAARDQLGAGGVRLTSRAIAQVGFALAILAIAQAATAGRSIYWLFPTEVEGPLPFGPFVNRNHFATWVIMAMPLCLGYLAARAGPRTQPNRMLSLLDTRALWMVASLSVMLLALLLSLSRSGALSLGIAAVATLIVTWRTMDRWYGRRLAATVAVMTIVAVSWADLPAIRDRLTGARGGLVSRVAIWQETLPMVRDFWLTGVGAGAYETAMRVYQRSDRTIYFNQAHNHYLQIAAEGGLLLLIPLAMAMTEFARLARRQIAADRTPMCRIRVGAACGLTAVALQSLWENGLVMPANSSLAAVLAAIVVYQRRAESEPPPRPPSQPVRVEKWQRKRRRDPVPAADEVGAGKQVLAQKDDTGDDSA
jgi:O-antigen ligase/polysaccharide polymerase Wzy-like membrane protein